MSISIKRLSIALATIIILILVAYNYFIDPDPTWDHSTDKIIIHTEPGAKHIDFNYIPDVRIWGDGHIIWVEHNKDGSRTVKEGFLSEEDLRTILDEFIDTGIFKPFRYSLREQVVCRYPGEDYQLWIHLSHEQAVEPIWNAENQLCQLLLSLSTGVGSNGNLYKPAWSWLHVVPIEKAGIPRDTIPIGNWPDDEFPFDLQMAYEEGGVVKISGDVLVFSWSMVNRSQDPIVISQGNKYWIGVSVPEISPY